MISLYHAAPVSALAEIKEQGLRPRGEERKGNFGQEFASLPEFVYFSRFKALNYGLTAAKPHSDRVTILEVAFEDLNLDLCFPDEDSVVFGMMVAEGTLGGPLHEQRFDELRKDVRPEDNKTKFAALFEMFGLLAYKGVVPFSAVRRYLVTSFKTLMNVTSLLGAFQPALDDIQGHRDHGSAVAEFMFDGTEISWLPRPTRRALRKASFNVYSGPAKDP